MDSVSQMALGASLAHVTLGKHLGRRALILGAALGTLPDLDVLVRYADAIDSFTYHRSWSHSLWVLSLVSLPIAGVLARWSGIRFTRCWLAVWLILFTHPLLDALTIYGTQIFWPMTVTPTSIGSVFIIDPLYTVPLLIAIFLAWRRPFEKASFAMKTALCLSTAYLALTLLAQQYVRTKVERTIAQQSLDATSTIIAPFPLSMLWRTVIMTDSVYYEGYTSLLDKADVITLDTYDSGKQAYQAWLDHPPVQRLDWFNNGMFALSLRENTLVASDLRMGVEQSYVFEFNIAQQQDADTELQAITTELRPLDMDTQRLRQTFWRVFDDSISLAPVRSERPATATD